MTEAINSAKYSSWIAKEGNLPKLEALFKGGALHYHSREDILNTEPSIMEFPSYPAIIDSLSTI